MIQWLRRILGIELDDTRRALGYRIVNDRIDKCALGTSVTALQARIEQLEETVRLMSKRSAPVPDKAKPAVGTTGTIQDFTTELERQIGSSWLAEVPVRVKVVGDPENRFRVELLEDAIIDDMVWSVGNTPTADPANFTPDPAPVPCAHRPAKEIDPTSIQGRILAVYRANPAQQYHYKEAAAKAGLSTSDEHLNSLRATHTDLTRLGVIERTGAGMYRARGAA